MGHGSPRAPEHAAPGRRRDIFMTTNAQSFFDRSGDFMTVHHVAIRGTNFEIGRALGELVRKRYGKSRIDHTADPMYARARRVYYQDHYPIHWQRVRGVAAAFGVDPDDDHYDFTGIFYNIDLPMPAAGCSVAYYPPATTDTGHGYLSRNYDFSVGTMSDLLHLQPPPEPASQPPPVMSEPYIMEWYPDDGGYASLAIHAFDALSGTLDGINRAGLVVSIMADEEAMADLGPKLEMHQWPPKVIGLHELQVMRWLLDTCATVDEAKLALLTVKQHYFFIPCHYIVADRSGKSFIYENSTGRNVQHVLDGMGRPQVVTNFQVHKHPTTDAMPTGAPTFETNAFWRYRTLVDRIAGHEGLFTKDELQTNNACVNILRVYEAMGAGPAESAIADIVEARTVWHGLYDQHAGTLDVSFYLGDDPMPDGTRGERRSEYLTFTLDAR